MAWSAAHEMGHVLGFAHNFKGKLYRDKDHPEILNSTVMDYPFPSEIPAYNKVGPADLAKISLSYLYDGDATSVETLNSFPFCSDEEASYKPDCTSFVPDGMTPPELADRYLKLILDGKPILRMEHGARAVIVKKLFFNADEAANKDAARLFRIYPGSDSVLVDDIQNIAEKSQPYFKHHSEANQSFVLKTISDCISNCPFTFESRKKLLSVIGKSETFVGFTTLQSLDKSLEAEIKTTTDTQKLTDSYRLSAAVKEFIAHFWQ